MTLAPIVAENNFIAARGFWFKPIERIRKAETFSEQVRYGWEETSDALTMVFRFLRKLGGQVPISALGGPVSIAKAAGYPKTYEFSSLEDWDRELDKILKDDGPIFVDLKMEPGEQYPEDFRRLYSIEYRNKFRRALQNS